MAFPNRIHCLSEQPFQSKYQDPKSVSLTIYDFFLKIRKSNNVIKSEWLLHIHLKCGIKLMGSLKLWKMIIFRIHKMKRTWAAVKYLSTTGHYKIFWSRKFSSIWLTLGTLSLLQTPSDRRRSRISHAKMDGHSRLYSEMRFTTLGVATLGLDPPMARGLIVPVS